MNGQISQQVSGPCQENYRVNWIRFGEPLIFFDVLRAIAR